MGNARENTWFLAYKKFTSPFDLEGLKIIEPKAGTYEADPFLVGSYLFFELYDYNKGVIAMRDLDTMSEPVVVIENNYHMSFPAIFEDGGEYYMTPETVQNGQLELYKATEFPYKWELVKILAKGWYDDPILYKHEGWYYILCTKGGNNFCLLRAKELMGEWEEHFQDCKEQARSAGNLFHYNGKLIRPTQNWEKGYGSGMLFYEFEFPYKTRLMNKIQADWFPNLTGTHTLNFNDKYLVIDGRVPYETTLYTP